VAGNSAKKNNKKKNKSKTNKQINKTKGNSMNKVRVDKAAKL